MKNTLTALVIIIICLVYLYLAVVMGIKGMI